MGSNRVPSYQLHKGSGRGFTKVRGRFFYFGVYGSVEARAGYDRFIGEWLANGRRAPVAVSDLTVAELCARYLSFAVGYYVDSEGRETSEMDMVRAAILGLKPYGGMGVCAFGPLAFKGVRAGWIERGLRRSTVNTYGNRVKRIFRWGVAEELVPGGVYEGLRAVDGLRRGRSGAKEGGGVEPVGEAAIGAIEGFVSGSVWNLVRVQLWSGARSGELVGLRVGDVDRSKDVWVAGLGRHKTSYRGVARSLYFGPRAQGVLEPLMEGDGYLFPILRGRWKGRAYSVQSYRQAVERGCVRAKVRVWSPHRLRHTAASRIRAGYGLEAAQVILGHARADVTQVYAERDVARAIGVVGEIG